MKKQHFHKCWYALVIVLLFAACNEDNPGEISGPINSSESNYFVDEAAASSIAGYLQFSTSPGAERAGVTELATEKEIETLTPIMGEDGLATCYVINYKGGGFVIMAADKRVEPIMAYSDENSFPVDKITELGGASLWLDNAKETVELIRQGKLEVKPEAELGWDIQTMQGIVTMSSGDQWEPMDPDIDPCPGSYTIGPLMKTKWGQDVGYNNALQSASCHTTGNYKFKAGCVMVALAQIFRYHQYPSGYNYSIMPTQYSAAAPAAGVAEMARLIKEVADASEIKHVSWGCDQTGIGIPYIVPALRNNFGYPSSTIIDFNVSNLINIITSSRQPVMVGGGGDGGHAWVCDGYKEYYDCMGDGMIMYRFLSMNWGYNGAGNDWYSPNYCLQLELFGNQYDFRRDAKIIIVRF